jgi:hypothetical protein
MGFRFRKSFKILPGVKINLSKSGISTSLGGKGATVNLGKRGVRSTVGLPGTGISYTTTSPKTKSISNQLSISSTPPSADTSMAEIATSKKPKIKIPFGCLIPIALIAICGQVFFCSAAISGIVNPVSTFMPALTATITQLATSTLLSTNTSLPTETLIPLPANTPYFTETLPPNCLQEYPSFCILPSHRIACDKLPENFIVLPPDSLGYDKDGDGFGCEK